MGGVMFVLLVLWAFVGSEGLTFPTLRRMQTQSPISAEIHMRDRMTMEYRCASRMSIFHMEDTSPGMLREVEEVARERVKDIHRMVDLSSGGVASFGYGGSCDINTIPFGWHSRCAPVYKALGGPPVQEIKDFMLEWSCGDFQNNHLQHLMHAAYSQFGGGRTADMGQPGFGPIAPSGVGRRLEDEPPEPDVSAAAEAQCSKEESTDVETRDMFTDEKVDQKADTGARVLTLVARTPIQIEGKLLQFYPFGFVYSIRIWRNNSRTGETWCHYNVLERGNGTEVEEFPNISTAREVLNLYQVKVVIVTTPSLFDEWSEIAEELNSWGRIAVVRQAEGLLLEDAADQVFLGLEDLGICESAEWDEEPVTLPPVGGSNKNPGKWVGAFGALAVLASVTFCFSKHYGKLAARNRSESAEDFEDY